MFTGLTDIYRKTSKRFKITVKVDNVLQNISTHTVRLLIKKNVADDDGSAIISKDADVATEGASGVAIFNLLDTDTNKTPGSYFAEIIWIVSASERYILHHHKIKILETVID